MEFYPDTNSLSCRVVYRRSSAEAQRVLWTFHTALESCETTFRDFLQKLEHFGLECSEAPEPAKPG